MASSWSCARDRYAVLLGDPASEQDSKRRTGYFIGTSARGVYQREPSGSTLQMAVRVEVNLPGYELRPALSPVSGPGREKTFTRMQLAAFGCRS